MNLAREIKKDIYWIGVNDRRTHIFENYWPIPKGVAYNSYIIVDEKVVVIDTIERSKMDDYVENIEQLLNGKWIISWLTTWNRITPEPLKLYCATTRT